MNNEEINRAIAEHIGWKPTTDGGICWTDDGTPIITHPDYCGDLNAMHEAEKTLDGTRMAMAYTGELREIINPGGPVGDFRLVSATARQRAEAFLRTVGKWRGEE